MKIAQLISIMIFILSVTTKSFPHAAFKVRYFKDLTNDYYIVKGDNLDIRSEPNINGKIVYQLKITAIVKVIKKSKEEVIINNQKGRWVYINTGIWNMKIGGEPIIHGWIFDYYLFSINNLKKVSIFHDCTLKWMIGDVFIIINTYKNGTYKLHKKNHYNNSERSGAGNIYRYENILFLKYDRSELEDLLYINKNNELCHIILYDSKNRACCKYKQVN